MRLNDKSIVADLVFLLVHKDDAIQVCKWKHATTSGMIYNE